MQRTLVFALFATLFATHAAAQVQVDIRLERARYLAGEPIAVVVDIQNVGNEAVGYDGGDVSLTVIGAQRRRRPDLLGCLSEKRALPGAIVTHPPLLQPGETISARYLLREFDLAAGQYELKVSGKAPVRWYYYFTPSPNVPAPPPPKHKESDPVPGAQFERTIPLVVTPATEDELKRAMAPLVEDADATDLRVRRAARDAIVESAPPFLEPLIARIAREDPGYGSAVDALGRLATTDSRLHLRSLFENAGDAKRSVIVEALARIGHQDDADFFARVLSGTAQVDESKHYAALGLGLLGGDRAVKHLEDAIPVASPEVRDSIARALGNTRAARAIPVLIGMYDDGVVGNGVCGALETLTHRSWCDGSERSAAAVRQQWLRWWTENRDTVTIYESDKCRDVRPSAPEHASQSLPNRFRSNRTPMVTSVRPARAFANIELELTGLSLRLEDPSAVHVIFTQGALERIAKVHGARGASSRNPDGLETVWVFVPDGTTIGRWQIVVDAAGRRSAPVDIDVIEAVPPVLMAVSPSTAHPGQPVSLSTSVPAQVGDVIEMTDARGILRRIPAGMPRSSISFAVPTAAADGEAIVRVGRKDKWSKPIKFVVTSAPLPLDPHTTSDMRVVAPGQWTDLSTDDDDDFEIERVDRIELEFRQGDTAIVTQTSGYRGTHVQVPTRLPSGSVHVRTRTWIGQTVSDWSPPAEFVISEQRVAPQIASIEVRGKPGAIWWAERSTDLTAAVGDALVLRGHFPIARAADLRVQLRNANSVLDALTTSDLHDAIQVTIPAEAVPGDWQLTVGAKDGVTPAEPVTTVRIR